VNTAILNWKRPLLKGDEELVKRSGRNEPIWVVIHICMVTALGISLYSYRYLLCSLFNNVGEQEGGKASAQNGERVGGPKIVYTCK
jgi:hypothetical protein